MSGAYIPLRSAFGSRRSRGAGSRALLFTLEAVFGVVAVGFIGLLGHWFQWLLPLSALLCLLIVVPTALLCGFWQAVIVSLSAVVVQSYVTARQAQFNPAADPANSVTLLAFVLTALLVRLSPGEFVGCVGKTIKQAWLAVVTVMLIVALAYLMNYSGLAYTMGKAVASTGQLFILLSPFLGWVAVMLSGSDTSGNALFGNLQVVAARQLGLNPVLIAATNSSGGVMGKMISPQNIATGVSVTNLKGREGEVLARTFWHSIILTLVLSFLVVLQQYVFPSIIPAIGG